MCIDIINASNELQKFITNSILNRFCFFVKKYHFERQYDIFKTDKKILINTNRGVFIDVKENLKFSYNIFIRYGIDMTTLNFI